MSMLTGTDQTVLDQTLTGNGESGWTKLQGITMLGVSVEFTAAGSGTIADFDLWVEASPDGGITSVPIQADQVEEPSNSVQNRRNIVNSKSTTTSEKYGAVYRHVPWTHAKVKWTFTGATTPSLPTRVRFCGK